MPLQCAERFYGIKARSGVDEDGDDSADDIESSIKKELESLGNKEGKPHTFRAVRLDIPCLLFFKTELPVDPAEFVHRICEEIVTKPDVRKMRYINRLTPVSCIGKATEKGLEEVGKAVLAKHFRLSGEKSRREEKQSSCSVSVMISRSSSLAFHASPRICVSLLHKPQSTTLQGSRPLTL